MEVTGPYWQTKLFSRLNEPNAESMNLLVNRISNVILLKKFLDVVEDLSYGGGWSRWVNRPIFKVKESSKRLWSWLVPMGKPAHFQSQTKPVAVNPPFCQFSCAIIHGSFSDPDVLRHFCQNISWTFVKILVVECVGLDEKTSPFSRFLTSYLPKNFVDIRQYQSYGTSWSRRENRPIVKVKRATGRGNPTFCQFLCTIVHGSFGDLDL
ncbi:hypothetical protein H5410_056533 [Solanum commersonii]|uniref:Uncharacterized protein n=1 Tax=Solanum commersonii TaxID=4109 RepID=A0A9J5WMG5_SOLCO|nr:hypothetical protein H5410_056533 [Solanum commersonii]